MKKKNINKIWSLNLVSHKIRHSDAFLSLLPKLEDIGGYKVFDKSKHWQNIEHCLFMMNMISNSARVHLSLDPTYHELGTLSTPIDTTTESEHHKVKDYLGPVFIFYSILYFYNIFLHIFNSPQANIVKSWHCTPAGLGHGARPRRWQSNFLCWNQMNLWHICV